MKRSATVVWKGGGKTGQGSVSTQSRALDNLNYGFKSRFENGPGTNPEELIAAAHAGCFTMKLSFVLEEAGFKADELTTECLITFENGAITQSHLNLTARIDGISQEQFDGYAKDAKENCPVSQVLNTSISLETKLN